MAALREVREFFDRIRDRREDDGPPRAHARSRAECEVRGCGQRTTERKPFCIDHLDNLPTYSRLKAIVATVHDELQRAAGPGGWREIDVAGVLAREILSTLGRTGALSPHRLRIRCDFAFFAVELQDDRERFHGAWESYVEALERAGFVKRVLVGSRRGTPREVVDLVNRPAGARIQDEHGDVVEDAA